MKRLAVALGLSLGLSGTGAMAGPATYKKSGPDPRGWIVYWVKCEDGNVATTQCLRDVAHCGDLRDQPLFAAAVAACAGIRGLVMEPVRK